MNIVEHVHPCDRANFWRHFERWHGSPRIFWAVLTYAGSE